MLPDTAALRDRPVLVTGAGGFVGSRVVRRLLDLGAHVRAWLGPAPASELIAPPPGVSIGFGDITDAAVLDRELAGAACVFHLAGPPSAAASFETPASFLRVHAVGTAMLLERCRAASVPQLVYVSSAEVYAPATSPVDEAHPCVPRSPYGVAKLAAEQCLAAAPGAVQVTIVRPFSIYGPGAPSGSLIATLVAAVRRGEAVRVADPRPVRDYCHVDDVAQGIVRAGCRPGSAPRTFNLASGRGLAVRDVALAILRAADRSDLVIGAREQDRPATALTLELVGDARRARDELGFRTEVTFEDGIQCLVRGEDR